jgi:hypothetical protein
MRLAAHPTTPPTPTAMGQSFIMTLYNVNARLSKRFTGHVSGYMFGDIEYKTS